MGLWNSKEKKEAGYSYLDSGSIIEGQLCFSGSTRLDGRVIGDVISLGTLVVESTAVIKGNVVVENLILSGTVIGNIQAFKHLQLNPNAKICGHISYGHLTVEGAVHEGQSHQLRADEIATLKDYCAAIISEVEEDAAQACIDGDREMMERKNVIPTKAPRALKAKGGVALGGDKNEGRRPTSGLGAASSTNSPLNPERSSGGGQDKRIAKNEA